MKSKVPSKPSKASLVARGLASKSKPPSLTRVQKSKEKPTKEAKPGYSLHASDSEDQAASVDRGLNKCAALLSNILDNEDKGFHGSKMQTKVSTSTKPVKSTARRTTTSHPPKLQKKEPQRSRAFNRHVVIPTANVDDRVSPSPAILQGGQPTIQTAYNDRLVSSTPVLTGEERERRNQLQRREVELQHELSQLKQRYELLQKQQHPEYQKQQRLRLQSSMMQELENHQKTERSPSSGLTHLTSELQTVLNSGNTLISNPAAGKSSAKRSLDYSGFPVKDPVDDSVSEAVSQHSSTKEASHTQTRLSNRGGSRDVSRDGSETQGVSPSESKKQVRIVSPIRSISPFVPEEEVTKNDPPNVHKTPPNTDPVEALQGTRRGSSISTTPPSSLRARPRSAPVRSRDRASPTAAENQMRMVQYLIDELRALLGNTGDLEVDRLLSEIDDSVKLLSYMLQTNETTHDAERALQPLRVENSQLRRKLQIANQNLKLGPFKQREENIGESTDLAFELAACRSINTVLQKQLTEEKNSKEEILRSRDQLVQNLSELQEEKKKFLQILSNKEQTFERCKREWQQETSRVIAENKKVKTDLAAVQFSTEAERKEINILSLSIKQKDAEISRLKELTRGLQHSLSRLLSEIQQFQPNSARKPGLLDTSISFEGLDKLLGNEYKTKVQITSPRLSPNVVRSLSRSNGISFTPLATSKTLSASLAEHFSGHGERETWKWGRNTPSPLSRKKLRFAEAADEVHSEVKNERRTISHEGSLREEQNDGDISSLSSGEEEEFRRDLANLDADIARIQKSLQETARRT